MLTILTTRDVTIPLSHNTIHITRLGSWSVTYHETWVMIRYVSRDLGHDPLHITILGSWSVTYHDTWVMIRYISWCLGHDPLHITILGSWSITYHDTWVMIRYLKLMKMYFLLMKKCTGLRCYQSVLNSFWSTSS